MRRFIEGELEAWKDSRRRKPLIVRGARQVGKTFSIEQLGRNHFTELATVDFERNPDLHTLFESDLNPKSIVKELEVLTNRRIEPGKTLLFFDEIQACPRAIMALRYFYEEMPNLHVVAAGSLLEFVLSEISFPVGRLQFLEMHPMSFVEYLWAIGKDKAAETVQSRPGPVSASVHAMLLDELKRYCFVGGMPEAVGTYVRTQSIQETFSVHDELCENYRQDFSKYAPRCDPACIDTVLLSAARDLGQQVNYSRLAGGFSHKTAKKALALLAKARLVREVRSATPSGLPLGAATSTKRRKAILLDVGLWQHLAGMKAETEFARKDLLGVYRGAMAEQLVGQEMTLSQGPDLYYWSRAERGSSAEVDYLAVIDESIHGIEVKSGPAGKLKSMHRLLEDYPNCRGIVFSSGPYAELPEQNLTFIPLYFALSATRRRQNQ